MNKNQENYKKAIDQIHVDPNLKDKVLEEGFKRSKTKKPLYYLRYAVGIAAITIIAVAGVSFWSNQKEDILQANEKTIIAKEDETEALAKVDIRRFKSIDELRKVLKEQESSSRGGYFADVLDSSKSFAQEESVTKSADAVMDSSMNFENMNTDYSKTNNQVENVDEADIVKTDGKYIYYSQNRRIYIVDTDLNLKATIKEEGFFPRQIFINGNKLVAFGNKEDRANIDVYNTKLDETDNEEVLKENITTVYRPKTYIRVYDLSDIENPTLKREVLIDGNYQDARMIENNVYLVTRYDTNFYVGLDELKDIDLLPSYEDSLSKKIKYINATDITYFKDARDCGYSLIAGLNLESNNEVNIETFFGAGEDMYVSENNMYIITPNYTNYWDVKDSTIYKFKLEKANVLAVASGTVKGAINNQFSVDEYKGNLRIATTSYKNSYRGLSDEEYEERYSTHLTILDENLNKIGEIKDLVKDEEIYSVRFMGKVGYVVTFQEIDPLWVIDLSNPKNPVVKGKLEIPGYSSYLHPYDETHILGIGYNVKDNGYGGVTNDTIKISMFDVSDLSNPIEIFNKTFEHKNTNSEIMYQHKALFFNKTKNLIGFPVSWWTRKENKTGLLLYKIDMENNQFEEIDDLIETMKYGTIITLMRSIYIGNNIYEIYADRIMKYDMNTFENLQTLELDYYDEFFYGAYYD